MSESPAVAPDPSSSSTDAPNTDPPELQESRAEKRAALTRRSQEIVQALEEEVAPLDDRGLEDANNLFTYLFGDHRSTRPAQWG